MPQLTNVFNRSFQGHNILEVSLVKDTDPNLKDYVKKHFIFLSIIPGVNKQEGGRTFDRNNRIVIKTDCEKLIALAYALRSWCKNEKIPYSIFVDPSKSSHSKETETKAIFCGEYIPKDKSQKLVPEKRQVAISFKKGTNNPIGITFPIAEGLAVADIMDFIGKKGIELEFYTKNRPNIGEIPSSSSDESSTTNVIEEFQDMMSDNISNNGYDMPPF